MAMAFLRTHFGRVARTKYFVYYCVSYASYRTAREMFAWGTALKEERYDFSRVHQRMAMKFQLPNLEPHEIDEGDSALYTVEKRIRKYYELPKLPKAVDLVAAPHKAAA